MEDHFEVIEKSYPVTSGVKKKDLLSPDVSMIVFTWITFFILLAILYKFAWKPILAGLDAREERIRRSLEDAEKARTELENIHATCSNILNEAERKCQTLIEDSKQAARQTAKLIEEKAREEAKILLENARQEILNEQDRAVAVLRKESARVAVQLAEKIIRSDLDEQKAQTIIQESLGNI